MDTIKFSRKSFWFKYWKFVSNAGYSNDAPEDTCALRKQLIVYTFLAIFSFPFFGTVKLLQLINDEWKENFSDKFYVVISTLFQCMIVFGSFLAADKYSVSLLLGYLYSAAMVIGILIGGIAIVAIIIGLSEKYADWKRSRPGYDPYKEKRPNIIVVLYRSAKDHLCSRIEYVD